MRGLLGGLAPRHGRSRCVRPCRRPVAAIATQALAAGLGSSQRRSGVGDRHAHRLRSPPGTCQAEYAIMKLLSSMTGTGNPNLDTSVVGNAGDVDRNTLWSRWIVRLVAVQGGIVYTPATGFGVGPGPRLCCHRSAMTLQLTEISKLVGPEGNWLSDGVLQNLDETVAHCCNAWSWLIDQSWRIVSIGLRKWDVGSDQRKLVFPTHALRAA